MFFTFGVLPPNPLPAPPFPARFLLPLFFFFSPLPDRSSASCLAIRSAFFFAFRLCSRSACAALLSSVKLDSGRGLLQG